MTKKRIKKVKRTKEIVHKVPAPPKPHLIPQIIFSVLLIIILISIAMTYKFSTVGQVVKVSEYDLDFLESAKVNVKSVGSWNVIMRTTNATGPENFTITNVAQTSGLVKYTILKEGKVLTEGLLGKSLSTSTLYLDEDDKPDVALSYNSLSLDVKNLNYIEPQFATITVTDSKNTVIPTNVIKSTADTFFKFKVSSTKKPTIAAKWKVGTLSNKDFIEVESDDTSVTYKLNWNPKDKKAHILIMQATVEDKKIEKQFIVTAGDYVYFLEEQSFPTVSLSQSDKILSADYSLQKGQQPISLLCGTLSLDSIKDKINSVKSYDPSYDNEIQQWKPLIPSEFTILSANKGYILDVKEPITFTVTCAKAEETLPTLELGWNLVGIPGSEPVSPSKLLTPVGGTLGDIYVVTSKENVLLTDNKLEPGKVYWVEITGGLT